MSLESLHIANFQAHEKCAVEFDPAITTIIGPSDVGKSAILRALKWVCLNLPAGDAFIREGSTGAICEMRVDGAVIRRTRHTDGTNRYSMDKEAYAAFGATVPDAIARLLSVDKINFVGQHEPSFWFSLSPSEVSRGLNAVVDLGIIDETNENIGKKIWQCQEAVRTGAERVATAKERKEALAWVVECDSDLQRSEALEKLKLAVVEKRQKLQVAADVARRQKTENERLAALGRDIQTTGKAGATAIKAQTRAVGLAELLAEVSVSSSRRKFASVDVSPMVRAFDRLVEVKRKREQLETAGNKSRELQEAVKRQPGDFSGVVKLFDRAVAKENRKSVLADALVRAKSLRREYMTLQDLAARAKREVEKSSGGVCPACGRVIE